MLAMRHLKFESILQERKYVPWRYLNITSLRLTTQVATQSPIEKKKKKKNKNIHKSEFFYFWETNQTDCNHKSQLQVNITTGTKWGLFMSNYLGLSDLAKCFDIIEACICTQNTGQFNKIIRKNRIRFQINF